jgi:hypothetical protein
VADYKAIQDAIARKRGELEHLQTQLTAAEAQLFSSLPTLLGLQSIDALIARLGSYASPSLRAQLQQHEPSKEGIGTVLPHATGSRKKTKITSDLRTRIIGALKARGQTAEEIAHIFGVSTPSVNLIKRQEGLTKKRE